VIGPGSPKLYPIFHMVVRTNVLCSGSSHNIFNDLTSVLYFLLYFSVLRYVEGFPCLLFFWDNSTAEAAALAAAFKRWSFFDTSFSALWSLNVGEDRTRSTTHIVHSWLETRCIRTPAWVEIAGDGLWQVASSRLWPQMPSVHDCRSVRE
jgi:hypothetical protein